MIFKPYKRLYVIGPNFGSPPVGDTLHLKPGSCLEMDEGAEICVSDGGVFIDENSCTSLTTGACFCSFANSTIEYRGANPVINNGAFLVIMDNGNLRLADSTVLTIDGTGSYIYMAPRSKIYLGTGSKIEVKNGAHIICDSTQFICPTSWQGIVLENAGSQTEIKNCTFNNAQTFISILNTSTGAYLNKSIKDNIFNVPSGGIGVYAENVFRIFLYGNKFNMTSNSGKGLHLLNTIIPTSEGSYDLKMIGNEFTGGQVQAALIAQTTEYLPIYFYGNKFLGTALYNIVGRKLVGNIKQNTNLTSTSTTGFHFTQSIPLLYNNKLSTSGNSIYLGSNSFPRMAPVIDPYADFLWYGGRNQLSSSGMDNIYIQSGYPITDYGTNSFTISSTQNFHIEGYLPDSTGAWYYTRNNCWYGNSGMPWTNLKKLDSIPVPPLYQNPNYNCNYTYTEDTPVIDDLGDGIYDTVIVTETNTSDTIALDEVSYGQAAFYHEESNYSMAIIEYKSLIDSFPGSSYINAVPDLLYDCYSSLDTSGSQDATDSLFSDLKLYMENKINSAQYDKTFNDECYDVILMCEAMMENYYDALTGYEFISLYHPDPETRLLASMDYSDIEDLLGEGGGLNNKPVNIENRKKTLDRLSDRDPVIKIIKKGYEKQSKDLDKRQTKEDKIKRVRVNSEVDMNVQRNLYSSRNLTKEEKRIRNNENILVLLSIGEVMTGRKDEIVNVIPNSYKLEQNYPNPFNPTTTISYSIPKDGLVNIRVYDITGREIRTLVNEIKVTGNYSIVFNGSNLSSGVYFYKIEAGDFVQTKRMVLIK